MAKRVIGSFAAGAAFMYFADPNRGRRRRAIARDKCMSGLRDLGNQFDKAGRDFQNRAQGVASLARSLWNREDVDGPVLEGRVSATIGRAVSHPHAIHVRAEKNGRIVLEGPVLRHDLDYLIKRVTAVPGVNELVSRLEVFEEPGNVPELQGGVPRRQLSELAQESWTPSLRVAAGMAAGAAFFGGIRNRGPLRWAGMAGGAALLARCVINEPFRRMLGIGGKSGAVEFDKTVHIHAPVEEVYGFWSKFENFPKFMTHLKEVRHLENGRWHWVAAGPGGVSIPWDAGITEEKPNQLLAWSSVPGSVIRTEGRVRFDKEPDGSTRVSIHLSYSPPAGVLGHAVAWLFGADPKSEIDDDMVRLKSWIETGRTRAHGTPVTREQVAPAAGAERSGSAVR